MLIKSSFKNYYDAAAGAGVDTSVMPKFTVNTPLSIFQFYKVFDPYSAFQAVQSYVSGVLGGSENPMIEVSNAIKIVKAGFDLKTSFRKDKEK
jgi:hypothetical protein